VYQADLLLQELGSLVWTQLLLYCETDTATASTSADMNCSPSTVLIGRYVPDYVEHPFPLDDQAWPGDELSSPASAAPPIYFECPPMQQATAVVRRSARIAAAQVDDDSKHGAEEQHYGNAAAAFEAACRYSDTEYLPMGMDTLPIPYPDGFRVSASSSISSASLKHAAQPAGSTSKNQGARQGRAASVSSGPAAARKQSAAADQAPKLPASQSKRERSPAAVHIRDRLAPDPDTSATLKRSKRIAAAQSETDDMAL